MAHRKVLIFVSLALSQTPVYTARRLWIRPNASCAVPVYVPAFAGRPTHCTYPQTDGQAESIWVAGYIPEWFTHLPTDSHAPSTNRVQNGDPLKSATLFVRTHLRPVALVMHPTKAWLV